MSNSVSIPKRVEQPIVAMCSALQPEVDRATSATQKLIGELDILCQNVNRDNEGLELQEKSRKLTVEEVTVLFKKNADSLRNLHGKFKRLRDEVKTLEQRVTEVTNRTPLEYRPHNIYAAFCPVRWQVVKAIAGQGTALAANLRTSFHGLNSQLSNCGATITHITKHPLQKMSWKVSELRGVNGSTSRIIRYFPNQTITLRALCANVYSDNYRATPEAPRSGDEYKVNKQQIQKTLQETSSRQVVVQGSDQENADALQVTTEGAEPALKIVKALAPTIEQLTQRASASLKDFNDLCESADQKNQDYKNGTVKDIELVGHFRESVAKLKAIQQKMQTIVDEKGAKKGILDMLTSIAGVPSTLQAELIFHCPQQMQEIILRAQAGAQETEKLLQQSVELDRLLTQNQTKYQHIVHHPLTKRVTLLQNARREQGSRLMEGLAAGLQRMQRYIPLTQLTLPELEAQVLEIERSQQAAANHELDDNSFVHVQIENGGPGVVAEEAADESGAGLGEAAGGAVEGGDGSGGPGEAAGGAVEGSDGSGGPGEAARGAVEGGDGSGSPGEAARGAVEGGDGSGSPGEAAGGAVEGSDGSGSPGEAAGGAVEGGDRSGGLGEAAGPGVVAEEPVGESGHGDGEAKAVGVREAGGAIQSSRSAAKEQAKSHSAASPTRVNDKRNSSGANGQTSKGKGKKNNKKNRRGGNRS